MYSIKSIPVFLGAIFIVLSTGCGTTRVDTSVRLPPRIEKLKDPQTVLVVDSNFSTGVLGTIRSVISSGQTHSVVDSGSASGGVVPGVIVEGQTLKPSYDIEKDQKKVNVKKRCTKRSKEGKKPCIKWKPAYHYYVYYVSESCSAGIHAKITDGESGMLLLEEDFTGYSTRDVNRRDKWPSIDGPDKVCRRAFDYSMKDFQKAFLSYKKRVRLVFVDVDDSEDSERAIEAAELGLMDRSKKLFMEAVEDTSLTEEARAWARYNLAILHEAIDELSDCREQVVLASEILGSDSKVVSLKDRCDR
jgi:hypothetical protein